MMKVQSRDGGDAAKLESLLFTASIDFMTVHTGGQMVLPVLDGKVRWARSKGSIQFSLHDVTANDVFRLAEHLVDQPLMELEVCIDARCRPGVALEHRNELLGWVMVDVFARRLSPREAPFMEKAARMFYRRVGAIGHVHRFDRRLPRPSDQQLHGLKWDPVQTKCYNKKTDMGRTLDENEHRARVEVKLKREALMAFRLNTVRDLIGFEYRKHLMPYFRHVRSARMRRSDRHALTPTHRLLLDYQQRATDADWAKVGVGSVGDGGRRGHLKHRLLRDTAVNDRLGQALHRLAYSLRDAEFVRFGITP